MKIVLIFSILITALHLHAGGISGGGGGTIIPDPAGANYIYQRLATARSTLLAVFKHLQNSQDYKDLFIGEDNILKKIQHYSLNIKLDQPCFDFEGQPFDGSINSEPNTICLSAFTIGDKVSEVTALPQLLALMAHEYSHLQGYDEEKAVELQTFILYRTRAVAEYETFNLVHEFTWAAQNVSFLLEQAEMFYNQNPKNTYKLIEQAESKNYFQLRYPLQVFDNEELMVAFGLSYRMTNLREYACTQWESLSEDKEMCAHEYGKLFKDADEISMDEYSQYHYGYTDQTPRGTVPNLVKHPEKYFEEIRFVSAEMNRLRELINGQFNIQY